MKALVYTRGTGIKLEDVPFPEPQGRGLIVKVLSCTICGSDIRVLKGEKQTKKTKVVLGHEIWGEVVYSGHSHIKDGERIALFPSLFCGKCPACISGYHNLCVNKESFGSGINGGFAEFVKVPMEMVEFQGYFKTRVNSPANSLIEPLGCVLNSYRQLAKSNPQRMLIVGLGPLGLMHLLVARLYGIEVFAVDRNRHRREMAKRLYPSAETAENPDKASGTFCCAVICAFAPEAIQKVLKKVKPHGVVNLFAGGSWDKTASITPNTLHYKEVTLTGTHSTTLKDFHKAGVLLQEHHKLFENLITHRFPLERYQEAFETYATRKGLKVALVPHGEV